MGNRFWEFYLIRYLAGTIFGALILFILVINYQNEMNQAYFPKAHKDDSKPDLSYFYSLLFETTRDIDINELDLTIGGNKVELQKVEALTGSGEIRLKTDGLTVLAAIIIAVFGFLYMYIASMLILILHAVRLIIYPGMRKFKALSKLYYFYVELSRLRSERDRKATGKGKESSDEWQGSRHLSEYIESYRHLREHGNAFAILLSEIVFAFWLVICSFSVWSVIVWVAAGSIAWFIGSYLEIRMVKERKSFLP